MPWNGLQRPTNAAATTARPDVGFRAVPRGLPAVSRRTATMLAAGALLIVLTAVAALLPVPYVVFSPGPMSDTLGSVAGRPLIDITGHKTYPSKGHLDLTTVYVTSPKRKLSFTSALRGWLDRDEAVVPRDVVYAPDKSVDQVEQENALEMQESQRHATTAALRELGIAVSTTARVNEVVDGGPSAGTLRAGDVIATVDGRSVATPDALKAAVSRRRPGDRVALAVVRDGRRRAVTVDAGKGEDGKAIIGVVIEEGADFPFDIDIQIERVGGPSAGLMFALGIVDKLTPEDLTGGRFVAGTGTIDDAGAVGPIGGIQQKIAAARERKAEYFLTPSGNCSDALGVSHGDVRLVEVGTLDAALDALSDIRHGDTAALPACSR